MFSKENRRFLILVSGMVILSIATMIITRSMVMHGESAAVVQVIGSSSTLTVLLVGLARAEIQATKVRRSLEESNAKANAHRNKIEEKVDDAAAKAEQAAVKAEKTAEVITQVQEQTNGDFKKALEKPAPAQVAMPRNHEELKSLVKLIADEFCDEAIDEKLTKAFEEQRKRDAGKDI